MEMERVLEFSGRSKLDGIRYKGTGVNQIDGELWLINGNEAVCPIEYTSLRISNPFKYGKYESPIATLNDLWELQDALMKTTVDFCKERNLTDIDCISFGADGLMYMPMPQYMPQYQPPVRENREYEDFDTKRRSDDEEIIRPKKKKTARVKTLAVIFCIECVIK